MKSNFPWLAIALAGVLASSYPVSGQPRVFELDPVRPTVQVTNAGWQVWDRHDYLDFLEHAIKMPPSKSIQVTASHDLYIRYAAVIAKQKLAHIEDPLLHRMKVRHLLVWQVPLLDGGKDVKPGLLTVKNGKKVIAEARNVGGLTW